MRWKILKQKLLLLTGDTPCELENGVFSLAMGFTGTILVIVHYSDVIVGAMTSQITASRLFTQPFIQAQIKENIKAPRHWPLCGEFTAQMASNADNVSIWWRHHATLGIILMLQQYKLLILITFLYDNGCCSWFPFSACQVCLFPIVKGCPIKSVFAIIKLFMVALVNGYI